MKLCKDFFLLYAITKNETLNFKNFYIDIESSLKGGVSCIQLRLKDIAYQKLLEVATKVKILCDKYNVPLIINDYIDIAKEVDSAGVHLGQDDQNIKQAKLILGQDKIIGISVSNLEQALEAQSNGATYLGVGSMFSTNSKPDSQLVSFDTLKEITNNINIPVVAIGGINYLNLDKFNNLKISGVAIISDIYNNENIQAHTTLILKKLKEIIKW
ncbi:MAG: thiamine phosphate synthase [Mycoplasma sp.]